MLSKTVHANSNKGADHGAVRIRGNPVASNIPHHNRNSHHRIRVRLKVVAHNQAVFVPNRSRPAAIAKAVTNGIFPLVPPATSGVSVRADVLSYVRPASFRRVVRRAARLLVEPRFPRPDGAALAVVRSWFTRRYWLRPRPLVAIALSVSASACADGRH